MLKRVVFAFALTTAASVAFVFAYRSGSLVPYLGYDGGRFLTSAGLVFCAVLLCRRHFQWPEIVFLACAIGLLAGASVDLIICFAVMYPRMWPWLNSQLFYLDTINPGFWQVGSVLRVFGLFFPLPLFALFWRRLISASNHPIQPTGGRFS